MKPGHFSSHPDKAGSHLKQARSRQWRDKNLHINTSSRDDFKNKCLQSYHVIKRGQRIRPKMKTNFSNVKQMFDILSNCVFTFFENWDLLNKYDAVMEK